MELPQSFVILRILVSIAYSPRGWRRRMQMKRYTFSMIGLAIVTAIIANPGIALACNKLIGT